MATTTEQDRRLLASKLFSDVVVRCGTRSWNLHRNILCSRSDYFRTALAGPFKEAEIREIDLCEHDEETIDHLVTWIYTKKLPRTVSSDGRTCYEAAVNLTGGDLDSLFRGVRAAYEVDFAVLKAVFTDFMHYTHFWPATDRAFREHLLVRVPRFSHDILRRIPELCRDGRYWPLEIPDACFVCCESAFRRQNTYWARLGSFEGWLIGFCNECQNCRRLHEGDEDEDSDAD
ncbi:hypothetical protein DL764_003208 [Monosporascus ibericus]|uniref:BTB domain-containing protein n=1 Tax=Monosporascus ibericus TaxID=155417 RepID=A0A4Q4TM29_9PEZI|nr:hypothetical protein DL764_003208 [Monosporascus ibericus]